MRWRGGEQAAQGVREEAAGDAGRRQQGDDGAGDAPAPARLEESYFSPLPLENYKTFPARTRCDDGEKFSTSSTASPHTSMHVESDVHLNKMRSLYSDAQKGFSALISGFLFFWYPDFCRILKIGRRNSSNIGQF